MRRYLGWLGLLVLCGSAASGDSAPWFGSHKVLRGGCWATRSRLIRNTWRNFYTPDRRAVFAGFRTCAR
jgi:EgtB-related family protein